MSTTKKPSRASRRAAPLCSALPGQNKNPLFIEFYPHTKCDCYKINLPWTKYRCHTLVLCDAEKGIAHAKRLARRAIAEHLEASLAEPMPNTSLDRPAASAGTVGGLVGGSVFLAYYHTGFTDDPPELLDVCDSEASAAAVIEAHKRDRDRDCEYDDKATWWTKARAVRTANAPREGSAVARTLDADVGAGQ